MKVFLLLVIFAAVFFLIFKDKVDRNVGVIYGAAATVLLGQMMNFFTGLQVIHAVNVETLLLMFGMMLYSDVMAETGVFGRCARGVGRFSKNDPWLVLVSFSMITFALSLAINNLTTMVIILPITVTLCVRAGVRPIPVIIAEVIASNLGGASSMIGDFPNMLIASSTQLTFVDFLTNMLPACLIGMAILFGIFYAMKEPLVLDAPLISADKQDDTDSNGGDDSFTKLDSKTWFGIAIFVGMIFLFILSGSSPLPPSYVATAGGLLALAFVSKDKIAVVRNLNYKDIIFFFCLFIMVGGLNATALLNHISYFIWMASGQDKYIEALMTMVSSGMLTVFLNAGPATALYIPIAADLHNYGNHDFIWWALSLGVCAGSSAAISGATSGAIASNYLIDYGKKMGLEGTKNFDECNLSFSEFFRIGIPFMVIFMAFSAIYLLRYY